MLNMNFKSLLNGKFTKLKMRFIASLRFALNDRHLFLREGVVGGIASNHPLPPPDTLNTCHSERSEESSSFNRTLIILI